MTSHHASEPQPGDRPAGGQPFTQWSVQVLARDGSAEAIAHVAGMLLAMIDERYDDVDLLMADAGLQQSAGSSLVVAKNLLVSLGEQMGCDPRDLAQHLAWQSMIGPTDV